MTDSPPTLDDLIARSGLRQVHVVAWRDLDDPEAGGSELHAHRVFSAWAQAGLDVMVRTSAVINQRQSIVRNGYRVERKSGRYGVFPSAARSFRQRDVGPGEALVEIWNGMPFFSPLWYRGPRLVFLHHVHAEMWPMVLPPMLAKIGQFTERRLAPPLYFSTPVVTLSESSRREIIDQLGFGADQVSVTPPGVDDRFSPGGSRSARPRVLAVGRLVPVKDFEALVRALVMAKEQVPELEAVIVGEGSERARIEALRAELGATEWIDLPGRLEDDALVEAYRSAWVLASSSRREGWGMTVTEAAGCGTPAVVSDIAGHRDAVVDGVSGLLVSGSEELAAALVKVLVDEDLRTSLGAKALVHAEHFRWDRTAAGTLEALCASVKRRAKH